MALVPPPVKEKCGKSALGSAREGAQGARLPFALFGDPTRLDHLVLDLARGLRAAQAAVVAAGELLAEFKAGFQGVRFNETNQ